MQCPLLFSGMPRVSDLLSTREPLVRFPMVSGMRIILGTRKHTPCPKLDDRGQRLLIIERDRFYFRSDDYFPLCLIVPLLATN
jgi:hypothetical protein